MISVTFSPTVAGAENGTLTITGDAGNGPQTISLSGTGLVPVVSLSPSSLSFSSQAEGTTSAPLAVTLSNTGGAALLINAIGASGDFAQTNNCGASVIVGASCTISVTFTPTAVGNRMGALIVTDTANGSPQTVSLSGTGTGPMARLSTSSLSFGGQIVSTTSAAQTTTFQNIGATAMGFSSVVAAGDFAETNNCGSSVAPSASCTIGITFKPAMGGTRSRTLTITDRARDSPQTVTLTGVGEDFALAGAPVHSRWRR